MIATRRDLLWWSFHSNGNVALVDALVAAAPGVGRSLYITDIVFSADASAAINLFFEEGAIIVLGPWYLTPAPVNSNLALHFQTPKRITPNTALTVTTSAGILQSLDVSGFIGGA